MLSLFAERILVVTGIRFDVDKFIFRSRFVPARQLWHPVSASALMAILVLLRVSVECIVVPVILAPRALTYRLTMG